MSERTYINGKKIAVNTIIVYIRLFIVTIIGLVSTRYALEMLGIGDYGLYNVVGGIVVVLNVFCTAMHTTTRRYINVEMGKLDGNVNRVFNICLRLHVRIAIIFFLLAEIVGSIYIYSYLNIAPDRLSDCMFIYNLSLIASCLGLINVPYQSTLVAHEDFLEIAVIDIISKVVLVVMIFALYIKGGELLRWYAIVVCFSTLLSIMLYTSRCYKKYKTDIQLKKYADNNLFREIIKFNSYTTMGAMSYMIRTQGANVVINFFFNTIVNGAYAIAYQIENYLMLFIGNLTTASAPQITKSYADGDTETSMNLVMRMNKLSVLLMLFVCFVSIVELPFLLGVWLGGSNVTEHMILFSTLTIVSAFIRSMGEGIPHLVQASGRIKWFQISSTIFTLLDLPFSIFLFAFGFPPQTIIIVFCISSILGRVVNVCLLYRILQFDVVRFLKISYFPIVKVFPFLFCYYVLYSKFEIVTTASHLFGLVVSVIFSAVVIFFIGFSMQERLSMVTVIRNKLKR